MTLAVRIAISQTFGHELHEVGGQALYSGVGGTSIYLYAMRRDGMTGETNTDLAVDS